MDVLDPITGQNSIISNEFRPFLESRLKMLNDNLDKLNISSKHIMIHFSDIIYLIRSSKYNTIIDIETYLSPAKGSGGQIAGFLDLTTDKINWDTNFLILSSDTVRKFVMFYDNSGGKFMENVILPNPNNTRTEEIKVDLATKVIPRKSVLQYFKAGLLMGEHSNSSEINMVGDCELFGYELNVEVMNIKAISFIIDQLNSKLEPLNEKYLNLPPVNERNIFSKKQGENLEKEINALKRRISSFSKMENVAVETERLNDTIKKIKSNILYLVLSILKYTNFEI